MNDPHLLYFEDIVAGARYDIKTTYKVSKEEIIAMASKWDPQPFHIDEEQAKSSIFGGLVASSTHIFPIFCWLGQQGERNLAAASALGFDKIRLYAPVRPGDELSYYYTFISTRESSSRPGLGIVVAEGVISNQLGEKIFTGEVASMVYKRPIVGGSN